LSHQSSQPQQIIHTQGLLFDMDGVLISSIGSVRRSWRKWAKHYHVPDAEDFEIPHGKRALEIIADVVPHVDPMEALHLIEQIEIEDTEDLKVLPGVRELLKSLPPERWAIVTSATRRLLLARLDVASLPAPERIVSADEVGQGKPHPEPYLRGAALLGFAASDCIVVEDAPSGVGAGLAAGARVLGVLGTHEPEELQGATWLVQSMEQVRVTTEPRGLQVVLS
jgi:sugar-phosphatase